MPPVYRCFPYRMANFRTAFDELLSTRLIPEFCGDPVRLCERSGFRSDAVRVSERDAKYFLMAFEAGLIEHLGRGLYRAPNSAASEQFFWEGLRSQKPRTFSLWLEPVITVAALARLHFDHGWPKQLIGTQSVDWAFDVVAFQPDQATETVAGEVKKSENELDQLIRLMEHFGRWPEIVEPVAPAKDRNAYKKVDALRARRVPLFWAVGPDGLSKVFRIQYGALGEIDFIVAGEDDLRFNKASHPLP